MSRVRDHVGPALAALVIIGVAATVIVLLRSANDRGVDALTRAKLQQVQTTADTFNARVSAQLTTSAGLGARPWALTEGSTADQRALNSFNLDPNAKSGYYLVDADGVVTSGVLLRPGRLGTRLPAAQWNAARARLAQQSAVIEPVTTDGLTTELPNYRYFIGIPGSGGTVRGAFVAEEALTPSSAFEQEINQLTDRSASTAAWFFLDSNGVVVATTMDDQLGRTVENPRYRTISSGVAHLGKRIVISADIPSIGWRVVFRQDTSEFTGALSGPLQRTGLILVLLLLSVGLVMVFFLVRQLRAAREQQRRLRELTRSQAEFISVVSHELRTPVAGVLGFLQTTVDHWPDLSDTERLSTVRRATTNARRLQAMTRDVLDTQNLESGRFSYSFAPVEVRELLRTAVELSNDADPLHPATLGQVPPVVVEADDDRLVQVVTNLLENARRNSPPDETVLVEAKVLDDVVRIAVIDHGPGLEPEAQERVFEKFARGDDNAVTGTGLGLYIARAIVTAHRGRIWCESEPGRRTAFVIELPVSSSVPVDVRAPVTV